MKEILPNREAFMWLFILIAVLCLMYVCGKPAVAQNKPLRDTLKSKGLTDGKGIFKSGADTYEMFGESNKNQLWDNTKQLYYFIVNRPSIVFSITNPDSTGTYKVYFNRKEVTFTSDSTFTFKITMKQTPPHTCPQCGGRLIYEVLTSMPPFYVSKCTKCTYYKRTN